MTIWKYFSKNIERLFDLATCGFWAEVERLIFFSSSRNRDTRKVLGDVDFYINEVFVVLHEDVIFRAELLDPVRFEHERLQIGANLDVLDIVDQAHHILLPIAEVGCFLEVASYSITEINRLPDIDDFPIDVLHLVHTWRCGKFGEGVFEFLIHGGVAYLPL